MIYLGVKGSVVALDRDTGQQLWSVNLKGGDFVNVHLDGDRLIATTKGEIFCLDARSGVHVWHNSLPGLGLGLVTVATSSGSSPVSPFQEKRRRDAAAAEAASTS